VIREVLQLIESDRLKPVIYEPLYDGLETVSGALADLDARRTWGKAVIRVRGAEGQAKL